MRALLPALLIFLVAPAAAVVAQENPLTAYNKQVYGGVKAILLGSAEKMPEEKYGFRPTDSVRSFGEIVGHAADAQYLFCSIVLEETNPAPQVEETKTSKAELVAALEEAFAYCDTAYDGMTETSATELVTFRGGDSPKLGVLQVNLVHTMLHYGNLVTYMRMNDVVPPTSEPAFMQRSME